MGTEITEDTTFTYTYAEKQYISRTVTFKVKNGAWDDGTTADKTVTLSGYDDKELNLTASQIPAVGNKPDADYKAGHWDVVPDTDANITNNTTYTYSYAHKDSITRTVTFKVVNGTWDDTTTADEIITLIGNEGDTLRLSAYQIPDVGDSPNEGFKAGSWDVTPSTETPITADTTYTYTYVKDEPTIPDQPTVTEVTHHSITIQVNPDEEASIDGGNTWVRPKVDETTVTFDNLEPGTDYIILIRKIAADGKDPSAPSEPLVVKTNPHGQIKSQVIIGDGLPNLRVDGFDDTLAAKLCTAEDLKAVEAGQPILFTLTVNKQDNPPAEDKALCDQLAAEIGQSAAFSLDISVEKKVGDAEPQKVEHLNGNTITISFDLPAQLTQVPENIVRTFYFIRVHHEKADQLPTTVNNDRLSFQTDKFSTYALAYQDSESSSGTASQTSNTSGNSAANANNSKTGSGSSAKTVIDGNDNLSLALAIAGMALVIGSAALAIRRKKGKQ